MPHTPAQSAPAREVVGTFGDRAHFEAAVGALSRAGFARERLSVLSSHESIAVAEAGAPARSWRDVLVDLVGDPKYEGPLVAAGLIALASGPVGVAIAGLVAAGVGGVAVKELLDEVAALPDGTDFARALAAGSVILWVGVETAAEEAEATRLLTDAGGTNVHVFERGAAAG